MAKNDIKNQNEITETTETKLTKTTEIESETTENESETTETEKEFGVDLRLEKRIAKDTYGKPIKTQKDEFIYNYVVSAMIRGREKEIHFTVLDKKGGYDPLEIVFDKATEANLAVIEYVQEMNGKKERRIRYEAQNPDETGFIWKCSIKPARNADINLINQYLEHLKYKQYKQ